MLGHRGKFPYGDVGVVITVARAGLRQPAGPGAPSASSTLTGKEPREGTLMETVTSADGTVIAYDRVGEGPVLIVCVGAFCTRATFVAPDDLARQFTVVTYDRRGRGDSGPASPGSGPFAAEREYEDFAAVAAGTWTGAPFVFGHSSGAAIALRAAAAGLPVAGVVAYEAPFGNDETPGPDVDPDERIRELVGAGRNREAVVFWMTDVTRLPEQAPASWTAPPG